MVLVHDNDLKCIENAIPPLETLQPDALMEFLRDYTPKTCRFQCGEYFVNALFYGPGSKGFIQESFSRNENESKPEVAVATVEELFQNVFEAPHDEGPISNSISKSKTTSDGYEHPIEEPDGLRYPPTATPAFRTTCPWFTSFPLQPPSLALPEAEPDIPSASTDLFPYTSSRAESQDGAFTGGLLSSTPFNTVVPSSTSDAFTSRCKVMSTLGPSRSAGSSSGCALSHLGKPPTLLSDLDESFLEAMRLQDEFDEEDRAIRSQRDKLAESAQQLFVCGICLEGMPYDSIACPDPCRHTFCRECLRGHVTSRLDEHRFPILCPTCTAGKGKGKEGAGSTCYNKTVNFIVSCYVSLEVSQTLALDLGLTDKQYSIWSEMEMASFSVLLDCRKYVHGVRPPHSSTNIGIGANGRHSWLEMITKKLR